MNPQVADMHRLWTRFTPQLLEILETWGYPRGVILVSKDNSAKEAARALASHLTESVFDFSEGIPSRTEWREKMAFLRDLNVGMGLFEQSPQHPCLLVTDFDEAPQWFFQEIKYLVEIKAKRPLCLIATATNPKLIPDGCRSMFFCCRKKGGPRKT